MKSGSEMPDSPEFGSLITASGFIEHMKAVARGKLKGLILQSEMPLSMAVQLNGNIFQDFMTNHDIALRIDNAPVLSDYTRAFEAEREEEAFFFQQDPANHDYMKASES